MPTNVVITSDYEIEDIDCNFKVVAGPGAGKTYWLVKHIQNILRNSNKLDSPSKIACITYTTVGAEEILERLGSSSHSVEVSTIHSFLYKNIVKPYIYLIRDEAGVPLVNFKEMDGHEEHIPRDGKVNKWKQENNLFYLRDDSAIRGCLADLDWVIEDGTIKLLPRHLWRLRIGRYSIRRELLPKYKELYWKDGVIHHEDVLYFSYKILDQNPSLKEFIVAKYPYVLLDEFQDTNPIQTMIIKQLAESGSVVGVIGDPAQSIYKFQGASMAEFISFNLPRQQNYNIEGNRRSTQNIISLLNRMRERVGLVQTCRRNEVGPYLRFLVSDNIRTLVSVFNEERSQLGLNNDYCLLARQNSSVTKLRSGNSGCICDVWDSVRQADQKREKFLKHILTGVEYLNQSRYEQGFKEILRVLKTDPGGRTLEPIKGVIKSEIIKRSIAVSLLEYLTSQQPADSETKIFDFYNNVQEMVLSKFNLSLTRVVRGVFKELSQTITMKELGNNLKIAEEKNSCIRTIHKAKGTEFQSVMVYLDCEQEITNVINPVIDSDNDDSRLLYVAFSRAKDFLCVAAPYISEDQKSELEGLGFNFNS